MNYSEAIKLPEMQRPMFCEANRLTAFADGTGPKIGQIITLCETNGYSLPLKRADRKYLRAGTKVKVFEIIVQGRDGAFVQLRARAANGHELNLDNPFNWKL